MTWDEIHLLGLACLSPCKTVVTITSAWHSAWGQKVAEFQFRDTGASSCIQSQFKTCCISTESPNGQGDLWMSSDPTHLLQQGHLEPLSQDHVQMAFEYLQGQRLHNLSGQPVPELSHPHSEKAFPDVRRESSVFQFVLIASGPVTGHHWIEPGSVLSALSLQVFIYTDKMPLSLLVFRLRSPIGEMLQTLNDINGPSLDSFQYDISLVLGSPGLDSILWVWPHQPWAEGRNHLPQPVHSIPPNSAQDTISLLCNKGTLLAQTGVHQDPQVLLYKDAFEPDSLQHVLVQRVVPSQVQDFPLLLVELRDVPVRPFLRPVEVPLDGSMILWCTSHSALFCVICFWRYTVLHHPDL